jgi:hypothetical protein
VTPNVFWDVTRSARLQFVDHGGFFRLAQETFVQRPFDGLSSTQYPELFPKFGEIDPDSQVMEANVRVPYQQLDKVVFTGRQERVTQAFREVRAL